MIRLLLATLVLLVSGAPGTAGAGDLLADKEAWSHLSVPGKPEAEIVLSPGRADIRSKDGVRFAYRPLPAAIERLHWRWRVAGSYPPSNPAEAGQDDRPLAVHLWIDHAGTDAVLFGTIARFLGFPPVTHVLTYAWGGSVPPGTVLANPYHENGRIIVLRDDTTSNSGWRAESRDLARDLELAFGGDVSTRDLRHLAISTDLDDLGGMATATIDGLRAGGTGE
jgi:hypothetical protein